MRERQCLAPTVSTLIAVSTLYPLTFSTTFGPRTMCGRQMSSRIASSHMCSGAFWLKWASYGNSYVLQQKTPILVTRCKTTTYFTKIASTKKWMCLQRAGRANAVRVTRSTNQKIWDQKKRYHFTEHKTLHASVLVVIWHGFYVKSRSKKIKTKDS